MLLVFEATITVPEELNVVWRKWPINVIENKVRVIVDHTLSGVVDWYKHELEDFKKAFEELKRKKWKLATVYIYQREIEDKDMRREAELIVSLAKEVFDEEPEVEVV